MTKLSRLARRARLVLIALLALPAVAMAATDAAPASPGLPFEAWIVIGIAALSGVETVIRQLRRLLGFIAPRTKTTLDDSMHGVVARIDDGFLQVLDAVRGIAPRTPVSPLLPPLPPPPPRNPQSGRTQVPVMGALAVVCAIAALVVAAATSGCAARQRTAAGVRAGLDCESRALAGTFAALLPVATDAVVSWISADGKAIDRAKLKAALSPLTDRDAQMACAITTALATIATPAPVQPDAPAAAGLEVDAAAVRAAFAEVRAELGWAPIATSAGVM